MRWWRLCRVRSMQQVAAVVPSALKWRRHSTVCSFSGCVATCRGSPGSFCPFQTRPCSSHCGPIRCCPHVIGSADRSNPVHHRLRDSSLPDFTAILGQAGTMLVIVRDMPPSHRPSLPSGRSRPGRRSRVDPPPFAPVRHAARKAASHLSTATTVVVGDRGNQPGCNENDPGLDPCRKTRAGLLRHEAGLATRHRCLIGALLAMQRGFQV